METISGMQSQSSQLVYNGGKIMVRNPLREKTLVIGIILLLLALVFSSPTSAYQPNTLFSSHTMLKGNSVRLIISEYQADGSITRVPIVMSRDEFNSLKNELREAQTFDGQLSVYNKYDIIPDNVTTKTLYAGMMEKAKEMGFSDSQENIVCSQHHGKKNAFQNPSSRVILWDNDSKIGGENYLNLKIHLGSSSLTSNINFLLGMSLLRNKSSFLFPSADILDIYKSYYVWIKTSNLSVDGKNSVTLTMTGFVGYMIDLSPIVFLSNILAILPFPFISLASFYVGYAKSICISYENSSTNSQKILNGSYL
jgi:hypothetical protein